MAGLDGIQNKIHPGDARIDLYDLPPDDSARSHSSGSLREPLSPSAKTVATLHRQWSTDEQIDAYIDLKMEDVIRRIIHRIRSSLISGLIAEHNLISRPCLFSGPVFFALNPQYIVMSLGDIVQIR